MKLSDSRVQQAIAAIIGLAIAFGGYFMGVRTAGRIGTAVLVLSVPAGIVFGWLAAKLLEFADHMLRE